MQKNYAWVFWRLEFSNQFRFFKFSVYLNSISGPISVLNIILSFIILISTLYKKLSFLIHALRVYTGLLYIRYFQNLKQLIQKSCKSMFLPEVSVRNRKLFFVAIFEI